MLLIDGVKYELWTPPSEDEFERIVKEHAQDIFGEPSEYFGKQKLESKLGKGSVPDGFVIMFGESPCWHIVEVELSSHDLHRHIVEQASRFIIGIRNLQTQNKIVGAIYSEIAKDDLRSLRVKKAIESAEIHRFLTDLVSKPPVLTIIIEKHTGELDEALSALAHPQIKVVEFQTFVREGVGLGAHAHLFEPVYKPAVHAETQPQSSQMPLGRSFEITLKPAYIKYRYIHVPAVVKDFFPQSATMLELETDIGIIEVGFYIDPSQGLRWLQKGLPRWFKAHPELKDGDKLAIEVIESMKRYRLRKA